MFDALRTYQPAVGPGNTPTLRPEGFGNPELEPEVGEELEVGFDASFFDHRIGLQFTYYDQSRERAIVQVPVRPSTGFVGTQFLNLGRVSNRGVEVGFDAALWQSEDWGLDLRLNFAANSNELTDLGVEVLAPALAGARSLDLGQNAVSGAGAQRLGALPLERLDLSGNPVDGGLAWLPRSAIVWLSLAATDLGGNVARLAWPPALEWLDVSSLEMGPGAAQALVARLPTTLKAPTRATRPGVASCRCQCSHNTRF